MPEFLLAGPHGVVRAEGCRARFGDVAAARESLRGTADFVVGALPFDPTRPAALYAPERWYPARQPWQPAPARLPEVTVGAEIPSAAEHVERVARVLALIEAGQVRKVVAARALRLVAADPIRPLDLAAALRARHPRAHTFVATVTEGTLVGASPEVLVSRRGERVWLRPLAGTAARRDEPEADRAAAADLAASAKNRAEHAFVVDWIRRRLAPICRDLSIPDRPELTSTDEVWHLATPIRGVLAAPAPSALDIAALLHPTPAVCGTPTDAALATILGIEGDRGFYGGAVGWCDRNGDGDWIVAIRCASIADDGLSATAYAGGGIVAGSEPLAELAETSAKFGTLLGVFGLRG